MSSVLSVVSINTQTVDLRQLEILQAIAETGSFTACGRKLHVSQSAISRQMILLEEELGEPLFLRAGRHVRMTPAAESLVQLGQRVFQDVRETVVLPRGEVAALRLRRLSTWRTAALSAGALVATLVLANEIFQIGDPNRPPDDGGDPPPSDVIPLFRIRFGWIP